MWGRTHLTQRSSAWRRAGQPRLCAGARASPPNARAAATGGSKAAGSSAADGPSTSGSEGPVVLVSYRGRTIEVAAGAKLRTALLQAGLTPHNGRAQLINCRGLATCGTCAVQIRGSVDPPSWTTAEQLRLNFPPHTAPNNQRLRLACQVSCLGDLQVTKYSRFWGQGDEQLADLAPGEVVAPPLGRLEYVLDPAARGAAAPAGGGSQVRRPGGAQGAQRK